MLIYQRLLPKPLRNVINKTTYKQTNNSNNNSSQPASQPTPGSSVTVFTWSPCCTLVRTEFVDLRGLNIYHVALLSVAEQGGGAHRAVPLQGRQFRKCISTTPIGAPIYICPRAATPPVPPLFVVRLIVMCTYIRTCT